jgi:hypothetical protein
MDQMVNLDDQERGYTTNWAGTILLNMIMMKCFLPIRYHIHLVWLQTLFNKFKTLKKKFFKNSDKNKRKNPTLIQQ